MWSCHKCGKPVFFAERKQSLGYDWHPECLRCEECGKRLNPGQHAEHKGVPYCHVPCYGALFGPQLFGHGTRVESHKNFGIKGAPRAGGGGPCLPRDHLESKLKVYNQFFNNKSMEIRSREVNNRLILEGALRVYWGVQGVIHLKEDDDQRMLVIRKRNSCRASGSEDGGANSEKEIEISKSVDEPTSATAVDGYSTDISLSESMVFDSCSLNEYPISELPTTPEDVTAETTGNTCDGSECNTSTAEISTNSTSLGATDSQFSPVKTTTTSCASVTLPSKLDAQQLEWDEIDELLQVERRINIETMPVKLPSSQQSSLESSPTKTISAQNSCSESTTTTSGPSTTNGEEKSSSTSSTSSDNFITASASLTTATQTTTTIEDYETDDATLKPIDFEDFKRSVHQDYVNGANDFPEPNTNSLKRNQPIDPSRINDSLKLYGENAMSKSYNCELRSIDASFINDTLNLKVGSDNVKSTNRLYALQKSGSASSELSNHQPSHINHNRMAFEKGINRSKSGPTCFEFSDSDDDDSTLKPTRPSTIRRSNVSPRYVNIDMNCYPRANKTTSSGAYSKKSRRNGSTTTTTTTSECDSSQMEANNVSSKYRKMNERNESPPLHVTEDGVVLRRPPKTGSTAIKRRSGNKRCRTKLKRRCSINGHYYNRETSFFTPPYGSQMSVWVTSLVTTQEVINLILEKYKVDSSVENFSLFVIRDNGEQKRLSNLDYPLISRVMLGPHEDVARLFLVDAKKTAEISNEVAQFLNLSIPECRAILDRYDEELEREVAKVREKYAELRRRIIGRMESLKVRL